MTLQSDDSPSLNMHRGLVADVNVWLMFLEKNDRYHECHADKRYNFLRCIQKWISRRDGNDVSTKGKYVIWNEFSRIVLWTRIGPVDWTNLLERVKIFTNNASDGYRWDENSDISVGTAMISSELTLEDTWMSVKAPSLLIAFQKDSGASIKVIDYIKEENKKNIYIYIHTHSHTHTHKTIL